MIVVVYVIFGKKKNKYYICKKLIKIFNMINVTEDVRVVYDISLDGTVVNALGMNVMSNTDG